jgi:hypothetical protein
MKMTYALKANELIHISDVEHGLKCGCSCPACNARLIARKGSIKEHHFAHAQGEDCKRGIESMLHIMAKSILEKENRISVPAVHVLTKYIDGSLFMELHDSHLDTYHQYVQSQEQFLSEAMIIEFEQAVLEQRVDEFIPDIALYTGNQCLLVEIRVSHGIDEIKLQRIRNAGISLLEVDLSAYKNAITERELKDVLVSNSEKKKWIYNRMAEHYKYVWLNLCDKVTPVARTYSKGKYSSHRTVYQIDDCPQNSRTFNGKSYANVQADCFRCKFSIEIEYEPESYDEQLSRIICVYCCGRNEISNISELKTYSKKE